MRSAARIYRLQLALALLGAGSIALVLLVVLRALDFSLPSADSLFAACRTLLMPDAGPGALLLLPLAALAMLSLTLGGRSLVRQVRGKRRFLARLRIVRAADLAGTQVAVFDSARPQAFCAGFLRPRIYLSTAAAALPGEHLEAVLAHERHHRRRRDPLRLLLARTLSEALFFIPVLRRLTERYGALAELAADEAAVREHDRSTLAAALLSFGEARNPAVVVGIAPERADHLLGRPPRWELPVSLLAGSAVAIGALVGAALTARALTSAAELNLPLLVAQSCMLVMLALPLLLAVAALLLGRPSQRSRS
jgi:Zn-dependent protease with chaperone function